MKEDNQNQRSLDSRIDAIEAELRALRAKIYDHSRNNSGSSGIHNRTPILLFGLWKKWNDAFSQVLLLFARKALGADIEHLFDHDYYLSCNPGLAEKGTNPVIHYLLSKSKVSPHWLFDREYYLDRYPDVRNTKVEPLAHFIRIGWREGRNPHPLFDTNFYLDQLPELRSGNLNPVTHYLHAGWRNGMQPHPLFCPKYYFSHSPDVLAANTDALTHYLLFGAGERREPHPWFDVRFYLECNPDVVKARLNPLVHYLQHGAPEGRDPHPLFETVFYAEQYGRSLAGMTPLEHFVRFGEKQDARITRTDCVEMFLPVLPYPPPPPRKRVIDVIVPVYRGFSETRSCIESILASRNEEPFELLVIDDTSPDPALSAWLEDASRGGLFTLLRNEKNLGFVATVNRGMSLHPDRDVVLLNSDTLVANDWLDRLVRCAYGSSPDGTRIGTVTPFSNNATICSYPRFCVDNPLPVGFSPARIDSVAARVNQGRTIDLPTAVGFCMYIRRDCLQQTGLFDVEHFGKGYGEENDFSRRAADLGWRNVLAADVFVYHTGGVSFTTSGRLLRERGALALSAKHPDYNSLVAQHVAKDPAKPYRFALTAARFQASGKPTVLLVTHDLGGGVGHHIEGLVTALKGQANFLILQPSGESFVLLGSADPGDGISIRLNLSRHYEMLLSLLRSCNVTCLHIHNALRHFLSLEKLRDDLNVQLIFTVHDHFTICPRLFLAKLDGRYCGEPGEAGCNNCIRTTLPHLSMDIASWRSTNGWLINTASLVIAPSNDVAARIGRHFPAARIKAAGHPGQLATRDIPPPAPPAIGPDEVLRVAVLGVMSYHKGLHLLERCAQMARKEGLPLEFVLVGYCEPQVRAEGPFAFRETGEYENAQLPDIIGTLQPNLIWFPVRVPETFSYTLSECLELSLPMAAPNLGALPERLSEREWTWIYDWDLSSEAIIGLLLSIRRSMISRVAPEPTPARLQADPNFYPDGYSAATFRSRVSPAIDLRQRGKLSVMALLSADRSGQLQSCAYIRAYLPLTHRSLRDQIHLTVTSTTQALDTLASVLLVQRSAVPTFELAERLVQHCRMNDIRIVYETDDDLFNIDESHPEIGFYTALIPAAELIASNADLVIVSNPFLKDRLGKLNRNIELVPNALDETLWFPAKGAVSHLGLPNAAKSVRILYMGTMTHSQDLQLLEEPMRTLRSEFGSSVELDIVGITPYPNEADWFNVVSVPGSCGGSYPQFAEWIRNENRWDFAVAPLVDNEFNRCKSYIKYLDYGALRLPGIFPGIGVFEGVVRNGETGFCVQDQASWYEAMRTLVTDEKLRRRMGSAAQDDVRANHTLSAQSATRRELWDRIRALAETRDNSTVIGLSDDESFLSS